MGYSPWGRKESDMTDTFPFKSRCSPRGWYWGAGDLGGGILLEPWARCYGWMSGEGLSCCHSQRCPGIRVKHGTGTLETSPTHGLLPSFAGAGGQPYYLHFTGAAGPGSLDSSRNLLITEAGGQLRTARGASSFSPSRPPLLRLCVHQEDLTSAVHRKGPRREC